MEIVLVYIILGLVVYFWEGKQKWQKNMKYYLTSHLDVIYI
jgi:hypothetical protein